MQFVSGIDKIQRIGKGAIMYNTLKQKIPKWTVEEPRAKENHRNIKSLSVATWNASRLNSSIEGKRWTDGLKTTFN